MVPSISSPPSSTIVRHVRSISLPSTSNPSILQVEEELAYLKTLQASSYSMATVDTVCGSLARLERLYISVNNLLSLPQTQQALSHRKDEKLVDELLDRSMRLLDVCGFIKDAVDQVKEHIRNFQLALRRKKEGLDIDSNSLKKIDDAKRAISALKQIDNRIRGVALLNPDHHLSSVAKSMRDTSDLSISIFGSLLSLKSILLLKPQSTKWSLVSNLIHKGRRVSIDQHQISNKTLESQIEIIESSLECMFRTLIKTRVSLLNIRSL